jgi:ADP-ribosylglycohydrolase/fructose-1,6-bisphosphatase/inositol monophosphatase family enzyme
MDLSRALETAVAAAREAGELLRRDFHRSGGPRGKDDKAEADREAEDLIRARLGGAFPDWGYLGEETGRVAGKPGQPVWLVDPNDGTRDYLVGRRGSAVSIGLLDHGRPVLGVVYAYSYPDDAGDLLAWAEGCGPLRRNGAVVSFQVPAELRSADVVLLSSKGDRDPEGNLDCVRPARYRTVPSIAYRLALLAAGEASAAAGIHWPGAWDYAAGHAMLRAAEGVLVDESGREVAYGEDGSSRTERAVGGRLEVARALAQRPWDPGSTAGKGPGSPLARLRPGEAVADPGLLSRAQGCLLGQIAGDSLGSVVEFQSAREVASRYPEGLRLLQDGGFWQTLAGQPTDDSELALALARSILAGDRYDLDAAFAAYSEWFHSGPFDVGGATRAALAGLPSAMSQANGSLMRVSPLGVYSHALPRERAVELARADSGLTHPHPVAGDAVAAFVVAVAHAVAHGDGPEAAYREALGWAKGAGAAPPVVDALERAPESAPVCDGDTPGWVVIALRNAFHELLRAPSLEEGVVATVRRGGDTDTNAAVAGALLGAVHGREAVPAQWRRMILSCRPHPLRGRRPRPMAYWPVDALEIAERLLLAGSRG